MAFTQTPIVQYPKPTYSILFKLEISDTLHMRVKQEDGTANKFFDLRRRNENGRFNANGVFLTKEEFPMFCEAIKNLPAVGMSSTFKFPTERILTIQAHPEYFVISATREKTKRAPASLTVGIDEIAMVLFGLPTVAKCLQ